MQHIFALSSSPVDICTCDISKNAIWCVVSVHRWLKDNKQISDGVTTRKNSDGVHSVLQFDAKQNATLTCSVKGKDGETSKNAHVFIIESKFDCSRCT
jgi:hypothetical protein